MVERGGGRGGFWVFLGCFGGCFCCWFSSVLGVGFAPCFLGRVLPAHKYRVKDVCLLLFGGWCVWVACV